MFLMDWQNLFNGFKFDYDQVIDDNIGAKPLVEPEAVVNDGNGNLSFGLEPSATKIEMKRSFINRLRQSWAQLPMDAVRTINNRRSYSVLSHSVS